jgi:pimeloyl-ACP methyl ester carboxylesterase
VPQPTLNLHGATDGCIVLDEEAIQAQNGLLGPGSAVERLPGAGHFFWVEQPGPVNERVLRFLGRPSA